METLVDQSGAPDTLTGAAAVRSPRTQKRRRARVLLFFFAALVVLLVRPASHHARAASLLVSFSDPASHPDVREERFSFHVEGAQELVPARLYTPVGAVDAPGVVLVHGVQYRGIEEPRLERFARSIAAAGIVVMTPAVVELSDYEVAPHSIETVGASIMTLRSRLGHEKVGLMGTSFGGGIALLTAADPRFADHVAFVLAIGAHDDLARVSTFFATNEISEPEGSTQSLRAHEYGATVLVYSHASDFFPPEDVPAARESLRFWLWEKRDEARAAAKSLSPASKEKVEKLFAADIASVRGELLAEIERRQVDMRKVSPHEHLQSLRANVYLLHGDGDTVIPKAEALWLAKDVPPSRLRAVLVSPAIVHVELKEPSVVDKWSLVHFMGQVLAEAAATR